MPHLFTSVRQGVCFFSKNNVLVAGLPAEVKLLFYKQKLDVENIFLESNLPRMQLVLKAVLKNDFCQKPTVLYPGEGKILNRGFNGGPQ